MFNVVKLTKGARQRNYAGNFGNYENVIIRGFSTAGKLFGPKICPSPSVSGYRILYKKSADYLDFSLLLGTLLFTGEKFDS